MSNQYYNSNFPSNFMGGNVPMDNSYMQNNPPPYNMYPVPPPVMHPGQHMVQHVMVPVPVPVQNTAAFAAYGPQQHSQSKNPKVDDLNYYLGSETARHLDRRSRSRSRSVDSYSNDMNSSRRPRSRNNDYKRTRSPDNEYYRSQSPEGSRHSRHSSHRKSSHKQNVSPKRYSKQSSSGYRDSDRDEEMHSRDRNPFKDRQTSIKNEDREDINSNPFRNSNTKTVPFRSSVTETVDRETINSNPFRNSGIVKDENRESVERNRFGDSRNRTEDKDSSYKDRDILERDVRSRERNKRDRNVRDRDIRSRDRNVRSRDRNERSRDRDVRSRDRDSHFKDRHRERIGSSRDRVRSRSRDYRDLETISRDQENHYREDDIEDRERSSYRERDTRSHDRRNVYQSTVHVDDLDNVSMHSDNYEHKERDRNRQYEEDLRQHWNESKRVIEDRSDIDDYDQDLHSESKRRKYNDDLIYDKNDDERPTGRRSSIREASYDRYNAYDDQVVDDVSDQSDRDDDLIVPADDIDRWSDRQRETSPISDGEIDWPSRRSDHHRKSDEFGKHLKITIENDQVHHSGRYHESRHNEDRRSHTSRSSNRDRPKLFIDGERVSERGTILYEDRDEKISKRGTILLEDRKEVSERGTILIEDRDDSSDSRIYDRHRESVRDFRSETRDHYDKYDRLHEADRYTSRREEEIRYGAVERDNRHVDNYPNYPRYPHDSRKQRNEFDNISNMSNTAYSGRRELQINPRDLRSNIGHNVKGMQCTVDFKVPTICLSYSTQESCQDPKCTKWHVCKFFAKGVCRFGVECKRGHDFFIGGIYKALCEANDKKIDFMKMNLKDVQYKIIGKLREQLRSYMHQEPIVVKKPVKEEIDPEFDASNYDECGNFIAKDKTGESKSEKEENEKEDSKDKIGSNSSSTPKLSTTESNDNDKKSDDNDKKSDDNDKKPDGKNEKANDKKDDDNDKKADEIDKKVDDNDKKADEIDKKVDDNDKKVVEIDKKVDDIDKKFDDNNQKADSYVKQSDAEDKKANDSDMKDDEKVNIEKEKEENIKEEKAEEVLKSKEGSLDKQLEKDDLKVSKEEIPSVMSKEEKVHVEKVDISPSLSPISVENIENWDEYERYEKVSDDETSDISDNELETKEELENISSDEETDFSSAINPRNFLAKTAVPIGMNDPLVFNPSKAAPPGEEPAYQPTLPYIPVDRPPPTHIPPPVVPMPPGPLFPSASAIGGHRRPDMYPMSQPGYPPVVPDITKPPPQIQPVNYLPSPDILKEVINSLQANQNKKTTPKQTIAKRKCDGDLEALAEKNPELNEVIQTPWQFPHKTMLNMSAIEFVTETEAYKEEFVAELMRILISIDLPYVTMKKLLALIKEKMLINITSHADMKKILSFYPECFQVIEKVDSDDEDGDPELARKNIKIKAKLSLGFCEKHGYLPFATGKCDCNALHICRFYFLNVCNKKKCKFGHQLKTNHNMTVFRTHKLHRMTGKEVITYIRDVDNRHVEMWPEVCRYYNREKGECYKRDNIDPDVMCHKLHLCLFFAKGVCYKHPCRRSHTIWDKQPSTLLQMYGLDPSVVGEEKVIQTLTDVVHEMERKKATRNVPCPANKKIMSDKVQDSMKIDTKPIERDISGDNKLGTATKDEKKLPSVRDRVQGPVKTLNVKLPLVCKFYNNELGCKKRDWGPSGYCMFIHVCQHFVSGDCKFGDKCKRSHDLLSGQAATLLQKHGLGPGLYTSVEIAELLNHPDELVEIIIPLTSQPSVDKDNVGSVSSTKEDANVLRTQVRSEAGTKSEESSKASKYTPYKSYSVEDMLEQIMKRGQEEQELEKSNAANQKPSA